MKNNCVLYQHMRLDTNDIFYVGISSNDKRPYDKVKRSIFWKSIVNKTEYEVQILKKDLSWEDACELEKILISWYGRRDLRKGNLVNMTDGGNGSLGTTPHNKGGIGFKHSDITKLKIGIKNRGKKISDEQKNNLSIKATGRLHTSETKKRMSDNKIGELNHQAKPIIDIETGVYYYSMNEIVYLYGYKKSYLSMMLNNKRKNKTNFRYA